MKGAVADRKSSKKQTMKESSQAERGGKAGEGGRLPGSQGSVRTVWGAREHYRMRLNPIEAGQACRRGRTGVGIREAEKGR
jgi:hypothetical protein